MPIKVSAFAVFMFVAGQESNFPVSLMEQPFQTIYSYLIVSFHPNYLILLQFTAQIVSNRLIDLII
jgi:Flp pilus assembly secretin CpaC